MEKIMINKWLNILICVNFFLIITGCMMESRDMAPTSADGSPQDAPYPRVESIIPLSKGNQWAFSFTAYDTNTNRILHPYDRAELNLDIPDMYGYQNDTLITLTGQYYNNYGEFNFEEYAYKYAWEGYNYGDLIAYRDQNVAISGVYIIGAYHRDRIIMYDTAQLWLAYPAQKGDKWQFWEYDTLGNKDYPVDMELVSYDASFYCPDTTFKQVFPLRFYKCYLYKQTIGNAVSYYYFNDEVGPIGYLRYLNGKLERSYMLVKFVDVGT
jgi:hypothetical protein